MGVICICLKAVRAVVWIFEPFFDAIHFVSQSMHFSQKFRTIGFVCLEPAIVELD